MSQYRIIKRSFYDGFCDYCVEYKWLGLWWSVKDIYGLTNWHYSLEAAEDTIKSLKTPIKYEIIARWGGE